MSQLIIPKSKQKPPEPGPIRTRLQSWVLALDDTNAKGFANHLQLAILSALLGLFSLGYGWQAWQAYQRGAETFQEHLKNGGTATVETLPRLHLSMGLAGFALLLFLFWLAYVAGLLHQAVGLQKKL